MKAGILLLFVTFFGSAQTLVKGLVQDSAGKPITFAGIGIIGKPLGTLSNESGSFEFLFTDKLKNDSVQISAIGFKPLTFSVRDFIREKHRTLSLTPLAYELEEIDIASKRIRYDLLGSNAYTRNNCSGFIKNSNNWKGSQAAILAGNKEGRRVLIESFSFYVIQNKYPDSLTFRLMFYEASPKKWPRYRTFLRKPVIFKVGAGNGEITVDLKPYNITTTHDFFVSLECLMDEMDISQFCYAGSYSTPSFVKASPFDRWNKVKGGGADFKVKVSYVKGN